MESDEADCSLSGLTQNTFLPSRIILDDKVSIIASILESENRDLSTTKNLLVQILVMPNRQIREIYHLSATKSWRKGKKAESR